MVHLNLRHIALLLPQSCCAEHIATLPGSIPSNKHFLLTKAYSDKMNFEMLTNSTRNSLTKSFFPGEFEGARSISSYEIILGELNYFASEGRGACDEPLVCLESSTQTMWISMSAHNLADAM